MNNIFLVLGYGVPKDILQDENYGIYLKTVFNSVFDISKQKGNLVVGIIFSGGETDTFEPYKRTEAEEMIRFFENLERNKLSELPNWELIPEKRALSTLENLLYSQEILNEKKIQDVTVNIYFEKSREKRVKTLAQKTLKGKLKFFAVDFSQLPNRYLDPVFLQNKEAEALEQELKALSDPVSFNRYKKLLNEKFSLLRNTPESQREEVLRLWWEKRINELER